MYRWIEGDRADPRRMGDPHRTARDLAGFFAALWSVDATDGPPPGRSNGFRGCAVGDERDSPIVDGRMRARIAALDGLLDTAAATEVYEAARAAAVWEREPVWVHGDPAPGNLLFTGGRLSAVIDFGTSAVGDPAVDLIAAWTWLTPSARAEFRALLGIDAATWTRGRGWGLASVLPAPADLTGDP